MDLSTMKEAINEMDKIRDSRTSYEDSINDYRTSLDELYSAEMHSKSLCQHIPETNCSNKKVAQISDVCDSMKQQLTILVEWAKCIPAFLELNIDDQVALLRSHAGEHLLLGLSKRSISLKDEVLLGNDFIIRRHSEDADISRIVNRILDEIVTVMRDIHIDDNELSCLKAIVFFDPSAERLSEMIPVKTIRHNIQTCLEDYVNDHHYEEKGRISEILLLLPPLQSITWLLIEQIKSAKLLGIAKTDGLIQEMFLGGANNFTSASQIQK